MRLRTPRHRDEMWDKAQEAGMGSGGRDGSTARMEPGESLELRQQELEQAHSPGVLLLPPAGSRAQGALECPTNIPHTPSEQPLSSRTFPVPTGVTWFVVFVFPVLGLFKLSWIRSSGVMEIRILAQRAVGMGQEGAVKCRHLGIPLLGTLQAAQGLWVIIVEKS